MLIVMATWAPVWSAAASEEQGSGERQRRVTISGGHDRQGAWLVAHYRDFLLRKRTERATLAMTVELRAGSDVVTVLLAAQSASVARAGRKVAIDSAEALESAQQLLGGSAAVFGLRAMLSELEADSAYTATDMALLTTAAFIASLAGDVGAPQRIADRFVEKHRGLFRQAGDSGKCWSDYSTETTNAWNDLQACMADADNRGFFRAAYERIACNTVWVLRSESAWFEYLNCISPLSAISQ
jgi:hypothetical protein